MIMLSLKSGCVTKAVCSVLWQIALANCWFYIYFESVLFSIFLSEEITIFIILVWHCSIAGITAAIAVLNCDVTTFCDHIRLGLSRKQAWSLTEM